jgi:hypothetical protein
MDAIRLAARFLPRLLAAVFLLNPAVRAAETTPTKVAIFVDNRAGAAFDDKVTVLEDFLASRLAGQQMQVLSREIVLNALKNFSAGSSSAKDSPGSALDRALSDNTSALRLAQNLGADYVLVPTISTYGKDSRSYTGDGIKTVNTAHNLRLTYRLAEAARGGEISGDRVTVSRTIRQTGGLQIENADVLNELLEEAADKLCASLLSRQKLLTPVPAAAKLVKVTIQTAITDFAALPNAGLNEKNEVVIAGGNAQATALDVTLELDGIAQGTAPGTFEVPPGLHKIRLTRDGFQTYERTVNFFEGQKLTVPLQMTEAGYARWKDVIATFTKLENNRKLTDAEVKVLEGQAQMLRQSGIKVDTQEGIQFFHPLYWTPTVPPQPPTPNR